MGLHWGILGLGKIAAHFANDLALSEHHTLQAVGSRSENKAKVFAANHQAVSSYGSYEELLQDSKVEIIYIATPHDSHKQYSIDALKHGKHVLCEKPSCVNSAELEEVLAFAKSQNLFYMEALWTRFNPVITEIIEIIGSHKIGEITDITADFSFQTEYNPDSRLFDIDRAGGSILDVGIYPLFLAYLLLGTPKRIEAKAKLDAQGIDLDCTMVLHYENAIATLRSGLQEERPVLAKIYGTKGSITILERWHEAHSYSIKTEDRDEVFSSTPMARGYLYEADECLACIRAGMLQSELWSHEDSRNVLQILDSVRDKAGVIYPVDHQK